MSTVPSLLNLHASARLFLTQKKISAGAPEGGEQSYPAPAPELAFYRKYTETMLRRYVRLSLSVGRMPALLGHDAFRGKMSTYRVTSFEDSVIFVYDMEKCLNKLDPFSRELIRRISLQEYTQGEAAALLHVSLRTIVRRYGEAVDRMTKILIDHRLLEIDPMNGSNLPG